LNFNDKFDILLGIGVSGVAKQEYTSYIGNPRLITKLKCNAVLNNESCDEIAEKQLFIVK